LPQGAQRFEAARSRPTSRSSAISTKVTRNPRSWSFLHSVWFLVRRKAFHVRARGYAPNSWREWWSWRSRAPGRQLNRDGSRSARNDVRSGGELLFSWYWAWFINYRISFDRPRFVEQLKFRTCPKHVAARQHARTAPLPSFNHSRKSAAARRGACHPANTATRASAPAPRGHGDAFVVAVPIAIAIAPQCPDTRNSPFLKRDLISVTNNAAGAGADRDRGRSAPSVRAAWSGILHCSAVGHARGPRCADAILFDHERWFMDTLVTASNCRAEMAAATPEKQSHRPQHRQIAP